jgi:Methyladenine glycosylase
MSTTIVGPDGKPRCRWSAAAPEFLGYHDTEWGFPVSDDHRLFEKLSLEGFQSGLSWRTILAKRENFRAAFHDFDFDRIARFTQRDHRPPSRQDRGCRQQCTTGSGTGQTERLARGLHLALRIRPWAACKAADRIDLSGITCPIEGSQKARLEIRRTDHGVCLHAGNGSDQRSR